MVIPGHALGLPVLRALSLCKCCRPIPRCSGWAYSSLIQPGRISLLRYGSRVGLHIVLFEACSAFTRVAACTLALSPIRDTLIEGFSHFVTSMTAPIASGWSGCRVGLAPTGKRRLCTAHAIWRHFSLRMRRPTATLLGHSRSASCATIIGTATVSTYWAATFNVLPYEGRAYPLNTWRQLLAARASPSKSVKMNQKVSNNVLLLASMAS